jgi:hypothetical protein
MRKQLVYKTVFLKDFDGLRQMIKIDNIPSEFLQHGKNYLIEIEREEDSEIRYSGNTRVIIYEYGEETDEEYEKRRDYLQKRKEENKKRTI